MRGIAAELRRCIPGALALLLIIAFTTLIAVEAYFSDPHYVAARICKQGGFDGAVEIDGTQYCHAGSGRDILVVPLMVYR